MREFEFTVRYARGVDDLMDVFIDDPTMRARTTSCFASDRKMWRLDYASGPSEALSRLDEVFLDESRCNECLDLHRCDEHSHREYFVMSRNADHRLYYTRRNEIDACHSLPYLAAEHVGDGVLLQAERNGDEYVWRVLMPEAVPVGELYDAVERGLRPGLSLELGHLREVGEWNAEKPGTDPLSATEREVIEAAVERGYYETPRGTTVAELGEHLDVPRSTAQYRLQRAEGKLVTAYTDSP